MVTVATSSARYVWGRATRVSSDVGRHLKQTFDVLQKWSSACALCPCGESCCLWLHVDQVVVSSGGACRTWPTEPAGHDASALGRDHSGVYANFGETLQHSAVISTS